MIFIKKINLFRIMLIFMLLTVVTVGWARGAYKWVDEDGTVHYSDRLRGDNAEVIKVPVHEPVDGAEDSAADAGSSGNTQDNPSAVDGEKSPQQLAMEKKQRKENCDKARDQYTRNQNLGRMYRVDANGERQYLSDKERADVLKKSKEAVDYWCK